MTVTNTGTKAERLNCVSSDAAAKCQIHEMTMAGGVMKMRPVEGGLEIKPGETVTLKPGGFHMMLVDLKAPLQQGKTVEVTLQIDNGGTVASGISHRRHRRARAGRHRRRRGHDDAAFRGMMPMSISAVVFDSHAPAAAPEKPAGAGTGLTAAPCRRYG